MPRDNRLRELLLDLARQLQEALEGGPAAAGPPAPPGQVPEGLTPLQRTIYEALTDRWQTAQRVANRVGHTNDSYFRGLLGNLVDLGLAQRVRARYRRA
jgi:hypothetical protein